MPKPHDIDTARKSRQVGIIIAVTMAVWLVVQLVGDQYGWPARYALLVDLAALAAFIWALVVTYRIWRKRRG